jgi:hypothetical protein
MSTHSLRNIDRVANDRITLSFQLWQPEAMNYSCPTVLWVVTCRYVKAMAYNVHQGLEPAYSLKVTFKSC